MNDETAPPLGHNNPPEEMPAPPKTIQERLAQDHADLVKRIEELEKLADAAPTEVKDEETFKPLSDLLKAGRVVISASEAARKIENEESRRVTAMIDAWFKNPSARLTEKLKAIKERTDAYLEEKKAAEEKRRKAEADRKAELAKEKAEDALWAEARAELAAYDARKAEEAAIAARLRKEAEARRADHLRDRAKRLKKVEPYLALRAARRRAAEEAEAEMLAQIAKDQQERDTAARLAQEAKDRELKAAADRLAQQQKAAQDAQDAKAATAAARKEETKATAQAERHAEAAEDHADQAQDLAGEAGRLGKRADRAERHANAGSADMSRTRSELGSIASLSKTWKVIAFDRNTIDLNLLRGFLHPDAVETAVRGYMMAHRSDPGGPKLEGAIFEQVEEGVYR